MKYIHYSPTPISKLDTRTYPQPQENKPDGFWFSCDPRETESLTWLEWCIVEEHYLERLSYPHEIRLSADANILHLNTREKVIEFSQRFRSPMRSELGLRTNCVLDWESVSKAYQGIFIEPYFHDLRVKYETLWYYGWDCVSGCIWDLAAIQSLDRLMEKPDLH